MTGIIISTPVEGAAAELPDEIRIPLHELQADVDYLFGRVAADSSCATLMAIAVKAKLAALEQAIHDTLTECCR